MLKAAPGEELPVIASAPSLMERLETSIPALMANLTRAVRQPELAAGRRQPQCAALDAGRSGGVDADAGRALVDDRCRAGQRGDAPWRTPPASAPSCRNWCSASIKPPTRSSAWHRRVGCQRQRARHARQRPRHARCGAQHARRLARRGRAVHRRALPEVRELVAELRGLAATMHRVVDEVERNPGVLLQGAGPPNVDRANDHA